MPLARPSATACNTSPTSIRPGTTDWPGDTPLGRPRPGLSPEKTVPFFRIGGAARRNRIPVLLHSSPASPLLHLQGPSRTAREEPVLLHFPRSPLARSAMLISHSISTISPQACRDFDAFRIGHRRRLTWESCLVAEFARWGRHPIRGRYVTRSGCSDSTHLTAVSVCVIALDFDADLRPVYHRIGCEPSFIDMVKPHGIANVETIGT